MSNSFPNYELVWMTSGERGTPWRDDFTSSNPGIIQHVSTGEETGEEGWLNCDRNIRHWWWENGAAVETEWLVFMEYDTLPRANLAAALGKPRPRVGMMGATVMQGVRDRGWPGFQDIDKLPLKMRAGAIGICPQAICAVRRDVLDAICSPVYDELFAVSMLGELRLTTIAGYEGFRIQAAAAMPNVKAYRIAAPGEGVSGIFHAIKP
ncbi:MAG: hypothetical protein ABIS50_11615 [Luteolibacter sp.]|uniref:hypothetical protein n=1 Tax=Luteolibacter sp. TaxID=1962973 RepID=UPI003263736A